MDNTLYYEELTKIKNIKGEPEKFLIPENISDKEKIVWILKKGIPVQKMAVINKIPYMLNQKEILHYTIQSILEYIEIWDESFQISFAKALAQIYSKFLNTGIEEDEEKLPLIYYSMNDILNQLIKFCMKIISTEDTVIMNEYLITLNTIVKFYSWYRKIKIENDAIEYACNLGSFGKTLTSRRFSVYFCSCLIQVFILYLFKRFAIGFIKNYIQDFLYLLLTVILLLN
jgi:hypothetical protein